MRQIFVIICVLIGIVSCQKEQITLGKQVSETFYLDNKGASMHVLVDGNTESKVFLIIVHGGPGTGALFYKTDYITKNIEDKYAVVYWDQRNAGSSQGNSNGDQLHLSQMTEDLAKLIAVLKYRYGRDISVFILGHSFGGLLAASFMTTGNNQSLVKGWIDADGSHNYPLNDTLTRQMLLRVGQEQILLHQNTDKWTAIVNYCLSHPGNFTLAESSQLENYASLAESYISEVRQINFVSLILHSVITENLPAASYLFNYLYSSSAGLNKELATTEFSSKLGMVTTPTLVLFGKYDFTCPVELGEDLYNRINTDQKKIAVSPVSGHLIMFQDEAFFCREVNEFIGQYK